jgi:hypothetical protein
MRGMPAGESRRRQPPPPGASCAQSHIASGRPVTSSGPLASNSDDRPSTTNDHCGAPYDELATTTRAGGDTKFGNDKFRWRRWRHRKGDFILTSVIISVTSSVQAALGRNLFCVRWLRPYFARVQQLCRIVRTARVQSGSCDLSRQRDPASVHGTAQRSTTQHTTTAVRQH